MQDWRWVNKYQVPGVSAGVKIGLTLSVVVVVGAIIAGLLIRRQRIRKTQNSVNVKPKPSGADDPDQAQELLS
ncbi:hypothetical protein CPB97_006203 [Podila verticillata]|nr:hypothetical protein CPB97_006203 [Podila verticillata]